MADLCEQLAQLIAQDNAVLLIGSELRRELGETSLMEQIADALARRIDYRQPERSLPQVAQDYETLLGRAALVQALKEEIERLEGTPAAIHRLIADAVLPGTKVITTRFDQVLERTLEQFHKPYVRIVRDTDLPFFDESKVTVIKIQGDISQPDSLVITDDDVDDFIQRLPTISDVIRSFFATKTLIFLGYELTSGHFKRLFREVSRELKGFRRTAYAITAQPLPEVEQRYWQQRGVELCVREPAPFLERLAEAVKDALRQPVAVANLLAPLSAPLLPAAPYKALESFTLADAAVFFGRKEESQRLANRILARQLTLLYGEAGSGKTSLLHAGVAPILAGQRALLAVTAPVAAQPATESLTAGLLAAGRRAELPPPSADSPAETIRRWQHGLDGPVVLAIDQFEQFFLALDREQQEDWLNLLAALVQDRSLFLRLVLVIREDFLGRMQALEAVLPGLWDGRFRLERLGREAARAAIVEPAAAFGVRWQPALVETLLDGLAGAIGSVAPPQLQIVCARLFRAVQERAAAPAETAASEITLAHLQELGGIEAILGDYLDGVVQGLPVGVQPLARQLLGALVSSNRVKQRLSLDDLARIAGCSAAEAADVLDELVRNRLVVRYEREGGQAGVDYELIHDYLASRIARWLGAEFWDEQKVRELVRQAAPAWQQRALLLSPDTLRLAAAYRGRVRFSAAEHEMLYASAVAYAEDASFWADQVPAVSRRHLLLALTHSSDAAVRARAAGQLPGHADEAALDRLVELAMADGEPAVRLAAARGIAAVERTGQPGLAQRGVARLAEAVAAPTTSQTALQALTVARDEAPSSEAHLPAWLRPAIRRRVWAGRWQRHRHHILAATLQSAQWGYAAAALTLGPLYGVGGLGGVDAWALAAAVLLYALAIAGFVGGAAAALGGFLNATLRSLADRAQPLRRWTVAGLATATAFALGQVLLLAAVPGSVWRTGSLFGLVFLASAATVGGVIMTARALPVPWAFKLAAALALGAAAFGLAAWFGQLMTGVWPLQPEAALLSGAGVGLTVLVGLFPGLWRATQAQAEEVSWGDHAPAVASRPGLDGL